MRHRLMNSNALIGASIIIYGKRIFISRKGEIKEYYVKYNV